MVGGMGTDAVLIIFIIFIYLLLYLMLLSKQWLLRHDMKMIKVNSYLEVLFA